MFYPVHLFTIINLLSNQACFDARFIKKPLVETKGINDCYMRIVTDILFNYYILYTPEAGMLESCIRAAFHPAGDTIAATIAVIAQKRATS